MANLTFTPEELTAALDLALGRTVVPGVNDPIIQHRPQDVSWNFLGIEPPAIVYMAQEDLIRMSVWTPTAGLAVNLSGRYLLPTGELVPFRETRYPTGASTRETFRIDFPECFLLSCEVDVEGQTVQPGECYVNVDILRGSEGSFVTFGHLIQSPVSSLFHPTWPWSPQIQQFDGRGRQFVIRYTNLGGGNDLAQGIPGDRRWRVLSITATLVTSGTVANRFPFVSFKNDGGFVVAYSPAPNTQTATQTIRYTWAIGSSSRATPVGTLVATALPDFTLLKTYEVDVSAENLQAGDEFTEINLYVEDWPESNS